MGLAHAKVRVSKKKSKNVTLLFLFSGPQNTKIWDTLGPPSGKFDFYVKYSAPDSAWIPLHSITP